MYKLREKIVNILNKIKGNKRVMYLTFCTVLILFCLVLNVTFSLMNQNKNIDEANIIIGDLKYKMIINEVELNESVGTKIPSNTIIGDRIIKLKAGKIEQFEVNFISQNSIDTKYEITYKVCTDANCTNFIDTPNTIQIAYHINTPEINGIIKANKSKTLKLVSDNQDDKDYYVQIDLNVGYAHNELALTNQIGNNFSPDSLEGTLSIIAYVDGVEVETFPTEPNYETGITCLYKNGTTSTARGVFRYTAGKGWVVDVYELDRSLTTCRVDFTKVLKVTYEVLSTRHNCANTAAGAISSDPLITYTGSCNLIQDVANADGTHTWRLKLLTNGNLTVNGLIYIDAFLVGGGGGGAGCGKTHNTSDIYCGSGGGGGYTLTQRNIRLDNKTSFSVVIGSGGSYGTWGGGGGAGGTTTAFGYSIGGGAAGAGIGIGGAGGSGGGASEGSTYGTDGGDGGTSWLSSSSAKGQGSTTREFAASGGELYSSGGLGSGGNGGSATANTGNGGAGGCNNPCTGNTGGSGVVVIRDVRT